MGGTVAKLDPTTGKGLTNIATGGFIGGALDPDKALQELDDKISGQDQKDAAKAALAAQEDANKQAIALARQQYEDFQAMTEPYRQAGESFLPQLTAFLDPAAQDAFRKESLNTDAFKSIIDQTTQQLAAAGSATGGLRSGNIQDAIAKSTFQQAQAYGDTAVQNRLNQLTQGVNLGLGTLGTTMSALGQAGQNVQQGVINQGNIAAQQAIASAPTGISPWLQLAGTGAQIYGATI